MSQPDKIAVILFFVFALFVSQARGVTCYSYRGKVWANQTQCEGSEACCGVNDECLPNRLCKSPTAANNVLVRGPCLADPWNQDTCAQICAFDEVTQNTGFTEDVFPRVEICDEGVYCCRFGDESCCNVNRNLVYLDANGVLLDSASSQTTTTTATTSTSTTAATSTSPTATGALSLSTEESTASAASTATEEPISSTESTTTQQSTSPSISPSSSSDSESRSDTDESLALKVGLGVGIPAAAIIGAFATWCFFFRMRQNRKASAPLTDAHANPGLYTDKLSPNYTTQYSNQPREVHEMAHGPMEGGWHGPAHEVMGSEVPRPQYR